MKRLAIVAVVLLALLDGCTCRRKTDEEILKARIDATPVHLWLAAKIAMHPDEGSEDVKKARRALEKVFAAVEAKDPSKIDVPPKDYAAVALALWQLRGLGKDALAKDDPAIPRPILAAIVAPKGELGAVLDANLEHAIFLVGLVVAKMHPKAPVPVPPEILLYEAWSTKASALPLESPKPVVRAVKAYVYGTSELCDLASREADEADDPLDAKKLAADAKLLGGDVTFDAKDAKELAAMVTVLGHGSTGLCYLQRKEAEKSIPHLRKTLEAAEALGVDNAETRFLHGWLECVDGDPAEGKKLLAKVIDDPKTPSRRKDAASLIVKSCGKGKGVVAKLVDRAVLAMVLGSLALELVEDSGAVDALAASKLGLFVTSLTRGFGGALEHAKGTIPSLEGAKESVKDLWK